jgi:hypothetical protein
MERISAQEVAQRGRKLYEERIRSQLEPEHDGRFLVVDVDSGEYAVADDELEAFARARERAPEGLLFLIRVGHRAAHRIGAASPSYRSR